MSKLSTSAKERIAELRRLLDAEERVAREQESEARAGRSDRQLEAEGLLCRRLRVEDQRGALFGRVKVVFGEDPSRRGHLEAFDVRPGAGVRVRERSGDGAFALGPVGIVVQRRHQQLSVVFDEAPELEDSDSVVLVRSEDDVTLRRMRQGLGEAERAQGSQARLLDVLLGTDPPQATRPMEIQAFDTSLHDEQLRALMHGVRSVEVGLIHGPPGTGKTRVLVEVIRQCVAQGERVLCLCASHAATDHLTLSLLAADPTLAVARAGHPARVHPDLEARTLAGLTEEHERRKLARQLVDDAFVLLRNAKRRSDRSREGWQRVREARAEAGRLFADARRLERQAVEEVLRQTRVLCGTLTGYQQELDDDARYDVLVVDEASQVMDTALLLGALRAKRIVLAGDHRQLPPTLRSREAAQGALAHTAFDRLMTLDEPAEVSQMLCVQHRMHEALMHFPSARFYQGRLRAHPAVRDAALRIEDDAPGLLQPTKPLDFIDTAGAGFEERQPESGGSRDNPGEADVVERLVRALCLQGLSPADIGVVSPYASQVSLLGTQLGDLLALGLEVDSVDGFQGREKEVILVSAVRSNGDGVVGFLSDARRLNVAITRAKRKLFLVGDSATLASDEHWNALIAHAIESGGYRSVFELPDPL